MASQSSSDGPFGLPPLVVRGGGLLLLFLVAFGAGFFVGAQPIDDLSERLVQMETTAQEREVQAAGLTAVDRNAIGPGGEGLDALERELGELDIRVAADLAQQRIVLSELARRLASILEL